MRATKGHITLEIDLPPFTTMGDFTAVAGSLLKAAAEGVDWERLYHGEEKAVSVPSTILLSISRAIEQAHAPLTEPDKPATVTGIPDQPEKMIDYNAMVKIVEEAVKWRNQHNRTPPMIWDHTRLLMAINEAGL